MTDFTQEGIFARRTRAGRVAYRSTAGVLLLSCSLHPLGCQIVPEFHVGYEVPEVDRAPVSDKTLLVKTLSDRRGEGREDSQAKVFLLYIPVVPYVSVVYNRLDDLVIETGERGGYAFSFVSPEVRKIENPSQVLFPNSFAETIARHLQRSRVFRGVSFEPAGDSSDADFVLEGSLLHDEYRVSSTSYLLGIAGVLLWFLPIPMEKVTGEVTIELTLKRRSGEVVWSREVQGRESSIRTMYGTSAMIHGTGLGAFTFQIQEGSNNELANARSVFWWHFVALHDAMSQVIPELEEILARQSSPTASGAESK